MLRPNVVEIILSLNAKVWLATTDLPKSSPSVDGCIVAVGVVLRMECSVGEDGHHVRASLGDNHPWATTSTDHPGLGTMRPEATLKNSVDQR